MFTHWFSTTKTSVFPVPKENVESGGDQYDHFDQAKMIKAFEIDAKADDIERMKLIAQDIVLKASSYWTFKEDLDGICRDALNDLRLPERLYMNLCCIYTVLSDLTDKLFHLNVSKLRANKDVINSLKDKMISCSSLHYTNHYMDVLKLNLEGPELIIKNLFKDTFPSIKYPDALKHYGNGQRQYNLALDAIKRCIKKANQDARSAMFESFERIIEKDDTDLLSSNIVQVDSVCF
jgi:hypothetical protein